MTSVLIVGSGAREHALAWKLRQSPDVHHICVAPGNAGTRLIAENIPIAATDIDGITRFVEERNIDLTVIGPEAPLALGLADRLRANGRLVVGPDAAAARIESSKAFAKDVMRRAGVPTARYCVYDDAAHAFRHLMDCRYPVVVKADGLAAGKGVVVCDDVRAARQAVETIMVDRVYGSAGDHVVIEEALEGPEISLLALVDGEHVAALPVAQDHKRLLDGNCGPNTGGMGAYAPVPWVDAAQVERLVERVMTPVVRHLAERGIVYRGFLFAGLMLTVDGPKVLEYNCRLGDPEAQVVLPLIEGDLLPYLIAIAGGAGVCNTPGTLWVRDGAIPSRNETAVAVVLAAPGYPEKPQLGAPVQGLDEVGDDLLVFHAGTALDAEGRVVTAGGRVLTVVATAPSIDEAASKAYAAPIRFDGMHKRGDIGRAFSPTPASDERIPDLTTRNSQPSTHNSQPSTHNSQLTTHNSQLTAHSPPRIAVLASGSGSNLQALIDARALGDLEAEIGVVISHNADAGALERARAAGIPAHCVKLKDRLDQNERHRMEGRILEILQAHEVDLVVLAGWMLILSAEFLERCNCMVINVHPALLDRFPIIRGAHAVRDALRTGVPYTGVTVHVVTPEIDVGPVLLSEVVPIHSDDDEESLYGRIKIVEHRLLPQAVNQILSCETGCPELETGWPAKVSPGGVYA